MQTPEELEADIIRRVFDESFLNEKLLTKLLHAYRDAERERIRDAVRKYHETLDDNRSTDFILQKLID